MRRWAFLLWILWFGVSAPLPAAEPQPLAKADAQKLMEAMEWTEITIIAIRQGVDGKDAVAPIFATIVGLGTFRSQHRTIWQTVYYDRDLGWYALELGGKSARIWTAAGYQEIKPWATW